MRIGFSKVDITPPLGTLMCGQLLEYRAKGIESNLYATAMYLDDGVTPVVFVSCDVLTIPNEMAREVGSEAGVLTGIPADNIIVCSTHTHSGPNTVAIFGMDADTDFITDFRNPPN